MTDAKKIEITRGNDWYKSFVGCQFHVVDTGPAGYAVPVGQEKLWVSVCDCKVVEYERLTVKEWCEKNDIHVGDRVICKKTPDVMLTVRAIYKYNMINFGDNHKVYSHTMEDARLMEKHESVTGSTYAERQKKWVRGYDLKVGDKVRLARERCDNMLESCIVFSQDRPSNYIFEVVDIKDDCIEIERKKGDIWAVKYYAIEPVKEELRKLTDVEMLELVGSYIYTKNGDAVRVIRFAKESQLNNGHVSLYSKDGYETKGAAQLLTHYTFLDGTPVGVKL